jgi:hypothetical protein
MSACPRRLRQHETVIEVALVVKYPAKKNVPCVSGSGPVSGPAAGLPAGLHPIAHEKGAGKRWQQEKGGRNRSCVSWDGLGGPSVLSRPRGWTIWSHQDSSPNGQPRCTQRRKAVNSASLCRWLRCSTQLGQRGDGQAVNSDFLLRRAVLPAMVSVKECGPRPVAQIRPIELPLLGNSFSCSARSVPAPPRFTPEAPSAACRERRGAGRPICAEPLV